MISNILKISLATTVLFLFSCTNVCEVYNLRCEYRIAPLAVETEVPSFSWSIASQDRGTFQAAYQILVADSQYILEKDSGNIWDTGKIKSEHSVNICYAGSKLIPGKCYFWKVRIWSSKDDIATEWSVPAMWRQVERNPKMTWIAYKDSTDRKGYASSIWYRGNYLLNEKPSQPVYADIATTGYYELYINGIKIGKDILSPSVSGRDKRTFYVTYDIKDYLQEGKNTIGIWVGRGWSGYGVTPVAFQCDIPLEEGIFEISSDASWKASSSSYATLDMWRWGQFGGECYDARKEIIDWAKPKFDDKSWEQVNIVSSPSPLLVAQPCELNRQSPMLSYQRITKLDGDTYEIDFGKSMTGNSRIVFPSLNSGDSIYMYFADCRWNSKDSVKTPAGIIKTRPDMERLYSCRNKTYRYATYNQHSIYVSAGTGEDVYESKFNPLGFRYIIVEGLKNPPVDAFAGLVETDLEVVGEFTCSDTLLNKIHTVNDWTMRCLNQGAVYVDCPQRERMGYGDGQVSVESSIMNYYMPSFYRKFVKDWALRQNPQTGALPHVAPNGSGGGGPAWPGIIASIAWRNYLYYNDKSFLEEMYSVMQLYLQNLESKCVNDIYRSEEGKWNYIGDWLAPGRGMDTNNWPSKAMAEVFNNSYRVYLWEIQRKSALALGKNLDAAFCANKIAQIKPLIHQAFYDEVKGYYVSDEQPYLMMPLMAGIVPDSLKDSLWNRLKQRIYEKKAFETGMLGTYFMINYLQGRECSEMIYEMVSHSRYPGWGYMLSQGATVWWEQWNGYYSHMHSVFTSLDSWFYQGIAGIQPIEDSPGMKIFRIKPAYELPLTFAKASTKSMYGVITSAWYKEKNKIKVCLTIPPNSAAEVYFPTGNKTLITENGRKLEQLLEATNITQNANQTICILSSGKYVFEITHENERINNCCK